jgi:hypothetical protein
MKDGTTMNESARLEYDEEGRGGRSDPLHESFGRSSQKSRFDLSFVPRENV